MRPVIFGEVLFDRFPDGREVLGGAPFNVAWNLQAFGASPLLVSRVGDDDLGRRIRTAMVGWGMDTSGLQTDREHPTGTVEVTFNDDEPSYEIVSGRAWDHIEGPAGLLEPSLRNDGLIYHGTLALRSSLTRKALAHIRRLLDADTFVDVNLRDPWWDRDEVLARLRSARWAKLNAEELALLRPSGDADAPAQGLLEEWGLECLIVTRGAEGAVVYTSDGRWYDHPAEPGGAIIDTVGAGDAFSAVALLGIMRGWAWPVGLNRAQQFAGAVVALRGATTTDPEFYQPFSVEWSQT